jgi:dienelactone hydrolase
MSLEGFETQRFRHEGESRSVLRRGRGPGVVIIHEIPGITPEVARFARWVAEAGFTVFLPSLFGRPGQPFSAGYMSSQLARACVSREFWVLSRRESSPVTDWLRALCRHAHAECGGPGVGALGMCLTGNFALSLMVDEAVMAPVLSQPSLPFPLTPAHPEALHLSDTDLATVKRRAAEGVGVLGLRFSHDFMCPRQRFERLHRELGDGFESIEIDSGPGNPHGIPRSAHSVLTKDLVDEKGHATREALDRVLALFRERLHPA